MRDNNKFDIFLKTENLVKKFDLDTVSDGAGRIRIYIFQKIIDGKEEYYLVRFGKKVLENPIPLI